MWKSFHYSRTIRTFCAFIAFSLFSLVSAGVQAIALTDVKLRKSHAGNDLDLPVDFRQSIDGTVTVEPRERGAGHQIVFQFDGTVTTVGSATATDENGAAVVLAPPAIAGTEVTVTLLTLADRKRVTVSLINVNNAALDVSASVGFLTGDVNGAAGVNDTDAKAAKARSGQFANAQNAQNANMDVNASGVVSAADISAIKARASGALPPVNIPPRLVLAAPAAVTAGTSFSLTVELRNPQNQRLTNYTGTVHFASGDVAATLPADYTFTAQDAGLRTFTVTLRTAGARSLTVTDTVLTATTASRNVIVNPGAPSQLVFQQQPANVNVRTNMSPPVTVGVRDAFGNTVTVVSGSVTVALFNAPAFAALSGTSMVSLVNGIATFNNLNIDNEGSMNLRATSAVAPASAATSNPFTVTDNIPPGAIGDLFVPSFLATGSSITVEWSAPGDDGFLGSLIPTSSYELCIDTSPMSGLSNPANCFRTQNGNAPAPSSIGFPESFAFSGLTANTLYYVRLKVDDGAGNRSFAFVQGSTLP
jgi:hypothetical protein